MGLTGNERADRLAKIGSQAPQTQNPVTCTQAKTRLHTRYNGDWKKENGRYQAHLDPIWRLERAQQTTVSHLCTGHCGLRAHLNRTGISDTSLCECGQADQTPDYVFQSCPKYAERRQLTWPHCADLATKLWGSAKDLYRTAGFVASTWLKILPARLSIAEEESHLWLALHGFVVKRLKVKKARPQLMGLTIHSQCVILKKKKRRRKSCFDVRLKLRTRSCTRKNLVALHAAQRHDAGVRALWHHYAVQGYRQSARVQDCVL